MIQVPKRLFYPVDYDTREERLSPNEQKKNLEIERRRQRNRFYQIQLQEEQYETDSRAIEERGRR